MKLLRMLLRHAPGAVLLATLAGVLAGAANAGLLALLNAALHRPHPWTDRALVTAFAALCLSLPAARALSARLLAQLGQRMVLRMRVDLCRRILAAPLAHLEEVGTPRLFAALTEDVASLVGALAALPQLFVQGAIVAGCLAYLGWLSLPALGAVVLLLAGGIVLYQLPVSRGLRHQRDLRASADRLWAHFEGVTGGVKELKLHAGRQDALLGELEATGHALKDATVRSATLFSAAAGWGQMVIFAVAGAVVLVLPRMVPMDAAVLTGYALILLYMMTPLEMLLEAVPVFARARVALEQVQKLGLSLDQAAPAAHPAGLPARWTRLELDGVTHAYHREGEDRDFVLGPVSFALHPGEVVFIVGGNGSGKTTLAKLLTGLYAPERGEVRVDGVPVTEARCEAYRQRFSVVFSDFHLFENLAGGAGGAVDDRAAGYLARLQLAHKVSVRGGRLSTTALSQGQRKRLALLTAYLDDRPVYLFDEWAADQDPVFKKVFYLELLPELKARGRTVVVITHDDHYFGVADRILKLDYGRLEYDGPPEGLRYALPPDPVRVPAIAG